MPVIPPSSPPGIKQSGLDLIKRAMRLRKVLAAGQEPRGPEGKDGLVILNQMLNAWLVDELLIHAQQRNTFSLTPTKQTYTLGVNGDFNMERPVTIEAAGLIDMTNPDQFEFPMQLVNAQQWAEISQKNLTHTLPEILWDDGAYGSEAQRNLSFYPVPASANKVALYTPVVIQQFLDLTTEYRFPPGYVDAIVYNLAVRLVEFGGKTEPEVAVLAVTLLGQIRSSNLKPETMSADAAVLGPGRYNIYNNQ